MKTLFLSRHQAGQLGSDLLEYLKFEDSSDRELFKGFKISFDDILAENVHCELDIEMTPIPEHTLISGEE